MERPARLWFGLGATTAVLFLLAAVLLPRNESVARFDVAVMASLSALRETGLTNLVQLITDLGSYRPATLLSFGLALVIGYRTRRLLEPLVLLVAVELSSTLVELFKVIIDRPRPPLEGMLGSPVFDYSFPSGHTASGAVLYVLGALLLAHTQARPTGRRLLVVMGGVIAVLIGLSRVYLGFHWLTDVVGAWLLALVLASIGMGFVAANPLPDPTTAARNAMTPRGMLDPISALVLGGRVDGTVRQVGSSA